MALTTDSKQISHVTSMTFTRMVESKQMIFIFIITIVASPVLATELEVVFIIRIMTMWTLQLQYIATDQ